MENSHYSARCEIHYEKGNKIKRCKESGIYRQPLTGESPIIACDDCWDILESKRKSLETL